MEASVCRHALESELPLSGVVVYVGGDAEAFSLGGKHSENCFNCMFEKTNLSIDGLATFVFSSLAEQISANYGEINAGEDWGVAYLKTAKEKWKPIRIQKSYMLRTQ